MDTSTLLLLAEREIIVHEYPDANEIALYVRPEGNVGGHYNENDLNKLKAEFGAREYNIYYDTEENVLVAEFIVFYEPESITHELEDESAVVNREVELNDEGGIIGETADVVKRGDTEQLQKLAEDDPSEVTHTSGGTSPNWDHLEDKYSSE